MEFLCSQCGACCKNITGLGLPHNGDGICAYLDRDNNMCSIYEERPEICRVEKIYEKYFRKKGIKKKDFYIATTKACYDLIDKEKLDKKYKIDIAKYN